MNSWPSSVASRLRNMRAGPPSPRAPETPPSGRTGPRPARASRVHERLAGELEHHHHQHVRQREEGIRQRAAPSAPGPRPQPGHSGHARAPGRWTAPRPPARWPARPRGRRRPARTRCGPGASESMPERAGAREGLGEDAAREQAQRAPGPREDEPHPARGRGMRAHVRSSRARGDPRGAGRSPRRAPRRRAPRRRRWWPRRRRPPASGARRGRRAGRSTAGRRRARRRRSRRAARWPRGRWRPAARAARWAARGAAARRPETGPCRARCARSPGPARSPARPPPGCRGRCRATAEMTSAAVSSGRRWPRSTTAGASSSAGMKTGVPKATAGIASAEHGEASPPPRARSSAKASAQPERERQRHQPHADAAGELQEQLVAGDALGAGAQPLAAEELLPRAQEAERLVPGRGPSGRRRAAPGTPAAWLSSSVVSGSAGHEEVATRARRWGRARSCRPRRTRSGHMAGASSAASGSEAQGLAGTGS